MALPSSPNHDGVRLFLPVFPFVAILAGLALGRFEDVLRLRFEPRSAVLGILLVGAGYLAPAWWQTRHAVPYYLSWYNELIGGLPGAEAAGMEVSYWYDAVTPAFISEIERVLPVGATVLAFPTVKYFEELQQMGLLRYRSLRRGAVISYRCRFMEQELWRSTGRCVTHCAMVSSRAAMPAAFSRSDARRASLCAVRFAAAPLMAWASLRTFSAFSSPIACSIWVS